MSPPEVVPSEHPHPYYIVAPRYERTSAGIRTLHLLCHWLNRKGFPAFIQIFGNKKGPLFSPDLIAPELTYRVVLDHFESKRTPIVVYPEVVSGNPLKASCVVRYLLNYPGLLGGDREYQFDEMVFAYSDALASSVPKVEGLLCMPVVDRSIYRPGANEERKGSCYYAEKFRRAGNTPFGLPTDCIEILRSGPRAQSREEIAGLFRRCEKFYCFEDTALILEAGLCGCPTVVMKSDYFRVPLGLEEFGTNGIAFDDSPEQISIAHATLPSVALRYEEAISRFWLQLEDFIRVTQSRASLIFPEIPPTLWVESKFEKLTRAIGGKWVRQVFNRG